MLIGRDRIKKVHQSFWDIGDNQLAKDNYILSCIRTRAAKRRRTKIANKPTRTLFDYVIKHEGVEFQVCKRAFLSIISLGRNYIKRLTDQRKTNPGGVPSASRQGQGM